MDLRSLKAYLGLIVFIAMLTLFLVSANVRTLAVIYLILIIVLALVPLVLGIKPKEQESQKEN